MLLSGNDNQFENNIIFCDTSPLITDIWSDTLIGYTTNEVKEIVVSTKDNYKLYLFLDCNIKWVEDEVRFLPVENDRLIFQEKLLKRCQELGIQYHFLQGDYESRENNAKNIIIQQEWFLKK
ncbi:hypothetical protein CYY_007307 [Polysphondylium violaceum]|uniref:NadR/Ttd14 AAA domain-containing protein n=1 Tax=Polysphondylium violaceum TaxID=133409 RepID=A0A8J4PNV4_9MYCE|nr:hypothetical protein CYY_007307 [Polysphondylium violaceum]